ncbi:hypothetical protein [uncultured Algibacter sp.]|uniref:hypothetical protein n=1 Tax=uncultured Algibacter sp. TaxID=298659 RepID=UPI003216E6FA
MFKINLFFKWTFITLTVIYAVLTVIYIINIPEGRGDEFLFILDLELIETKGWINAIKKNISIPYMVLAYPFTLFLKKHVVLRVVSLLLNLGLIIYFKRRNNPPLSFFAFFAFYLSSTIFFFYGTNDTLFNTGLIIFLNEVFQLYENDKFNSKIAFSALIIAFFTRALILVYLPVIIIAFYIIYKYRNSFKLKLILPVVLLLFFIGVNLPSLRENGKLSYDLKSPPETTTATWVQRQYLAQLMVNKGALRKGSHPTWGETQAYIEKNGKKSLPVGLIDGVLLDLKLTFKEFFKDIFSSLVSTFRQLGGIIICVIVFPLMYYFKHRKLSYQLFIPVSVILMLAIFSFIIISNVELRWLASVFVMAIVWYVNMEQKGKLAQKYSIINYLMFIVLVCYGGFRMFNKII